jgi:aspartyl-tRNA synthetase
MREAGGPVHTQEEERAKSKRSHHSETETRAERREREKQIRKSVEGALGDLVVQGNSCCECSGGH